MTQKEKYINFSDKTIQLSLFHQPWWLDIMTGGNWDVILSQDGNGVIKAAMPYQQKFKFGLPYLIQPSLTPYLGIYFAKPKEIVSNISIYSFENEHSTNIINQINNKYFYIEMQMHYNIKNWYPFYYANFQQTTRYTYILDNIKDHQKIKDAFSNTIRRQIKEAEKNCTIREEDNVCIVFSLVRETLKRKKISFDVSKEKLQKMDDELRRRNQRLILTAYNSDGQILSGIYICWDHDTAYLLGLGMDSDLEQHNSVKALIWEAIKKSSAKVDKFNFEGSMAQGVERLYRSFGGEMVPYFKIYKYKNRIVRSLMSLINR